MASRSCAMLCAVAILALALCPVACMAPKVYRDEVPLRITDASNPASPEWVNPALKKGWTPPSDTAPDEPPGLTGSYGADKKYMMLLHKPKPETWRHQKDMISDMIWGRAKD